MYYVRYCGCIMVITMILALRQPNDHWQLYLSHKYGLKLSLPLPCASCRFSLLPCLNHLPLHYQEGILIHSWVGIIVYGHCMHISYVKFHLYNGGVCMIWCKNLILLPPPCIPVVIFVVISRSHLLPMRYPCQLTNQELLYGIMMCSMDGHN